MTTLLLWHIVKATTILNQSDWRVVSSWGLIVCIVTSMQIEITSKKKRKNVQHVQDNTFMMLLKKRLRTDNEKTTVLWCHKISSHLGRLEALHLCYQVQFLNQRLDYCSDHESGGLIGRKKEEDKHYKSHSASERTQHNIEKHLGLFLNLKGLNNVCIFIY